MRVAEPPLFLKRLVGRYVRAFAPERIVLFGSYAKGTNGPASDVDLLIVAKVDTGGIHCLKRAHQLAADCFPRVDVVFATPEDVEHAETAASPFLMSILGNGVTIYEARRAVDG
jgi:uncharacterized protein